ncbi:GH3 auxin-responsive promoter family protein [filamentous cyanobacterium LEGE 11480]|uniref:GH3 auxin-responsive promoter family protein n=1 Tax=Romeriopsis navalis LEGE 11480 TaxID=2777977 RepID=A0A928VJX0_9CYAN|nr:GH3 auxin-responsive promoter family protein [Romeriopsis navalis]MBE9029700.1 GH3 auxin-responsive promoter family protein [Romeriopsis navalis LEGE 11480]
MRLLIKAFALLLIPIAHRFERSLQQPQVVQAKMQQELVDRLIQTDYGEHWKIQSIDDWDKLPIVTYDDLQNWINYPDTHSNLAPEPIIFYEKTSGSRGASKQIPYTKSLRRSFSQMFCVWAYDLIQNVAFTTGKVYFCVSPKLLPADGLIGDSNGADPPKSPLERGTLKRLIPPFLRGARGDQNSASQPLTAQELTLQTDADYLDPWLAKILSPFLITLPDIHRLQTPEEFKQKLAIRLIQASNLEIISIWNPSFLTILLDYITQNRSQLKSQLQDQIIPQRLALLDGPNIPWTRLWPQLKLISCWDSANAADTASELRSRFPSVCIQGKGLLATEAPMTVPLSRAQGCVPVLTEVFFEFVSESGEIFLLHQLAQGETYSLIISQKGGLYRYRIGDRVRVTHFYHQTPCLEFVGREGGVSDLVGEKLNPDFVQTVLQELALPEALLKTLVPVNQPLHYVLLLDQTDAPLESIAAKLDNYLCQTHHYAQARALGQLERPKVLIKPDMADRWIQFRTQNGSRWGDVKNEFLFNQPLSQADLDWFRL